MPVLFWGKKAVGPAGQLTGTWILCGDIPDGVSCLVGIVHKIIEAPYTCS